MRLFKTKISNCYKQHITVYMKVYSVINTTVMQLSHHIATTKLVIAEQQNQPLQDL